MLRIHFLRGGILGLLILGISQLLSAQAVPVHLGPDTAVCLNESLSLDATFPNGIYQWSTGATTPTVTVSGFPLTVSVTVTDTTGAFSPGSDTIAISGLNIPPVGITPSGTVEICPNGEVMLSGSFGGTSNWYRNGLLLPGPFTNYYTATLPGNYNMTKTNQNGCTDSAAVGTRIEEVSPPAAAWTASTDTVDLGVSGEVTFTDASSNATAWMWDFGDGNTSTDQNPTHSYNLTGTYTVLLTAENSACQDTASQIIVAVGVVSSDPWVQAGASIHLFPIPATSSLTVLVEGKGKYRLELISLWGERMMQMELREGPHTLDVTRFPRGVYGYRLSTEERVVNCGTLIFE